MASTEGPSVVNTSQIVDDFESFGITLDEESAVLCVNLCKQYGIDGEQLAVCWLTFSSSHGYDSVTPEAIDHFDRVEQISLKKAAACHIKARGDSVCIPHDDDDELLEAYGGRTPSRKTVKQIFTPESGKSKQSSGQVRSISAQFNSVTLSPSVANPSLKYSTRTNSGFVVTQYGATDITTWTANPDFHPQVKVLGMGTEDPLTKSYKYMFEKAQGVAEAQNDSIMSLAEQMRDLLLTKGNEEEEDEEYLSTVVVCNDTFSTVGKICCDSVGHLNVASVLLEGSWTNSNGAAVPLDLTNLMNYSIFPGQIVGVRGVNPTGEKLQVQELVTGKVLPLPVFPVTITSSTGPVQLVVASGPFTTNSNLLYEPLTDLLTNVRDNPPHLLILLGPFLDAAHPLVLSNDVGETHDAVFTRCLRIIASTLESSGTRVILVPSSRDVCSSMVYPTPPYAVEGNFICVSDPALLNIEGVLVTLTATDILFHLGKEEISFPPQAPDRLGRLARHILMQQSLYPLCPGPENLCLDQEQVEIYSHLPWTPHLLVIPSDLRYFVKEVEECVVVNPERLAKGLIGGTYARLELHPSSNEKRMVGSITVKIIKV